MAPTPSKMSSTLRSNSLHIGKIEGLSIRPGNYIEMNCALPFTAYAHPLSCRSFTHPTEPLQVSQARPLTHWATSLGTRLHKPTLTFPAGAHNFIHLERLNRDFSVWEPPRPAFSCILCWCAKSNRRLEFILQAWAAIIPIYDLLPLDQV